MYEFLDSPTKYIKLRCNPFLNLQYGQLVSMWLLKIFFASFCPMGPKANAPKQETGTGEAPPPVEDEEKKKQKRGMMTYRLFLRLPSDFAVLFK